MTVARTLARFATAARFGDLPDDAIEIAKRCFLDGMAVILAGSREPCARIARDHAAAFAGAAEAWTFGSGSMRAPAQIAAFANGVAGHALDYDDTALSLEQDRSVLIHPTMPPLCAILALAEHCGASGPEILAAFVLGFEAEVKIAEAIHPDHFAGGRGFHSTGTIGVFGSTIAASRLMGLSEDQATHALALAATMAGGLGVNHGTMAKPLNMGRAAETGVMASRLASRGFDGPEYAFEAGRGFFEAFGGGYFADRIGPRLGSPFAILDPGTSVKPYPSGVVGHPGMDAMKALVAAHAIDPAAVERIDVRTGPNVIFPGPLRITHARTALEAKFCVPFQMSAILLRGKAGLAEFSDDFVASDDCQAMQRKVSVALSPDIAALGKGRIVFEIDVTLKNGQRVSTRSDEHYRGGPQNPLSWDELCEKLQDCAAGILDEDRAGALAETIWALPELDNASDLLHFAVPGVLER